MLRSRLFSFLLVLCAGCTLVAGVATARAATVCAAACDFSDLQAAIDASAASGLVKVGPGTYAGPIRISRGVQVVAQISTSDMTFTVTGDGTAPTVTIAPGSVLQDAHIEGSGTVHPALLVEASLTGWSDTADIWFGAVHGGSEGVVLAPGASASLHDVSLVGNSAVGIRLLDGAGGTHLTARDVSIAGSLIGIDAVGASIDARWMNVTVGAGGVAARLASTAANLEYLTVDGTGAAGASGIEFVGTRINGSSILNSRFTNVSPAIRLADASSGNHQDEVTDNLFKAATAAPPLLVELGAEVRGSRNFVACPDPVCPLTGGAASASMAVSAFEPKLSFGTEEGLPAGASSADNDVAFRVSFREESDAPSMRSTMPLLLASAQVSFADDPKPVQTGSSSTNEFVVHTGAAGQTLVVTARVLGRPVSTWWDQRRR